MSDTLTAVVAIGLAAVLMFVFPLMTMSDRTDDVSQLTVETAVTDFVDDVRTTGVLSPAKYSSLEETIGSTGNSYDVELKATVVDANPGKKTTQSNPDKIGQNATYDIYTSQILEKLDNNENFLLKEGDIFTASAKNTNQTLAQQLKNFFYSVTGNDTYTIAASHSGIVTATGK